MNQLIETKVSLVALSYKPLDGRPRYSVLLTQVPDSEPFELFLSPEEYGAMRERMHDGKELVLVVGEAEQNEKDQ